MARTRAMRTRQARGPSGHAHFCARRHRHIFPHGQWQCRATHANYQPLPSDRLILFSFPPERATRLIPLFRAARPPAGDWRHPPLENLLSDWPALIVQLQLSCRLSKKLNEKGAHMNCARRDLSGNPNPPAAPEPMVWLKPPTARRPTHTPSAPAAHAPLLRGARRQSDARGHFLLPLRVDTADLLLRFLDGAMERYQLTYATGVEIAGSGSEWQYRGYVSRGLSIYNRAGECFTKHLADRRSELATPATDSMTNGYRAWRNWPLGQQRPDPDLPAECLRVLARSLERAFMLAIIDDKRRLAGQFERRYPGATAVSEVD